MQYFDKISTFDLFKFSVFTLQTILSKNIISRVNLIYPFFQYYIGSSTDHEIKYFIPKEIENIIIKKSIGYTPKGEKIDRTYLLSYVKKYYGHIHISFYKKSLYMIKWVEFLGGDFNLSIINPLKKYFGKESINQVKKTYKYFPLLRQITNINEIINSLDFNEKELRNQIIKQLNRIGYK